MSRTESIEQPARDAGLSGPRRYLVDWERVEAAVGTRLPADCKEYVHRFGPGDFGEYLIVCVPGVENGNTELAARLAREQRGTRLRTRIDPKVSPRMPLFPEPGGSAPEWIVTSLRSGTPQDRRGFESALPAPVSCISRLRRALQSAGSPQDARRSPSEANAIKR
ncbi:hypothetical protein [Streptomyces hirsutus]|uniref:hypothetical protein n=1 Tax=Streptomyces hirsutus TaxID=35620 RepID=UPI0006E14F13|nr:hypothetical protein [Streptomyces hirsutus]